ncbi:helix-turn-helix domain-containing protein [Actinotalea sp.]|uniref:helix-turn-helix domain-containing protein n=1 Tax=Actinotalea sp. TaxID=1872145 RepID=UPI00356AE082
MATNLTAAIADAVREHLRRRGVSQRTAGPLLGMSQQALSDRLTGRTPFTLADLERLADLLDLPVSDLLQPRQVQEVGA